MILDRNEGHTIYIMKIVHMLTKKQDSLRNNEATFGETRL